MGFTVASRGRVGLYAPLADPALAPLGRIREEETSPGTREVTGAMTRDGEWVFERQADGTWSAGHLPTKTELKTGLESLIACQAYAGSGRALADLEQEGHGNG